jgi:hypothetical protein
MKEIKPGVLQNNMIGKYNAAQAFTKNTIPAAAVKLITVNYYFARAIRNALSSFVKPTLG